MPTLVAPETCEIVRATWDVRPTWKCVRNLEMHDSSWDVCASWKCMAQRRMRARLGNAWLDVGYLRNPEMCAQPVEERRFSAA